MRLLRDALAYELRPIKDQLERFSGLPQTVTDLTDQVVKLTSLVERLELRDQEHTAEFLAVGKALREMKPTFERVSVIGGETIPELVGRVERIADQLDRNEATNKAEHKGMLGEIHRLESDRAAGAKP
jgi:hypothetical protein